MLLVNVKADRQTSEAEKMAAAAIFDAEIRKKQAIIQAKKRKPVFDHHLSSEFFTFALAC